MKNSFVLYTDYLEQTKMLNNEQMGILFRAILQFASGGSLPPMDDLTKMAFNFIRVNMERDADKYEAVCEKRRQAGKLGGRPKKEETEKQKVSEKAKKAKGFSEKQKKQKPPDNDNENENDNDIENENDNDINKSIPLNHTYIDPRAGLNVKMYSAKAEDKK